MLQVPSIAGGSPNRLTGIFSDRLYYHLFCQANQSSTSSRVLFELPDQQTSNIGKALTPDPSLSLGSLLVFQGVMFVFILSFLR